MQFVETKLPGAYVIELERKSDQRGFFARAWCQKEFTDRGLRAKFVQCNVCYSDRAGTLRGIHFQREPHAEAKLVRCIRGALYDVVVDLRPGSPTFGHWIAAELSADNRRMIYVPEGFGHGCQTLTARTEIFYQTSEFYHPESAGGVRYDDPAFAIDWPREVTCISASDLSWPDSVASDAELSMARSGGGAA